MGIQNKRGWTIAFSVFIINVCIIGVIHTVSVILVALQKEFNATSTSIGWVGSISTATVCSMSPLSCFLYELTSHRKVALVGVVLSAAGIMLTSFATNIMTLFFTFGIIFGIGGNFVYNPLMNLLSCYFPHKHCSRATSLAVSGTAIGMLSLGPIFSICFTDYGWRMTLRIFSIVILLVGVLCCVPFDPPPPVAEAINSQSLDDKENEESLEKRRNKFMKYLWILKLPEHWLFNFAIIFSTCAAMFNLIYLVSLAESLKIEPKLASHMVAISAGGQLIGRFLCIVVGDKLPFPRVVAMCLTCLLGTGITVMLLFIDSNAMFIVYVIISGIPMGIHWSLIYSVAVEIFGIVRNSEAVGYLTVSIGLAALFAPYAFGKAFDATGIFDISILICAAFWFMAALCYFVMYTYMRCCSSTDSNKYVSVPSGIVPVENTENATAV
ncbi:monocarboxylate transporter 13-like isoform X2 [Anneissia japonica]|uniref:monocarboxylate transporter 13-like isoform X2 n=1 Tax=Anneissia japonica TaxID=1529436 RepID=UPI0014255BA3|nr:monocarboxylate transporter 13-like isoform X2 [Anneissia japonica]